MSTKAFGIYASNGDVIKSSDDLVIEVSGAHTACMVKRGNKNSIVAFELFTYHEVETSDFEALFAEILVGSKMLDRSFSNTYIYINNPFALAVPVFKFNKEISADYLNLVFGEDSSAKKQFDHLETEPDLMNVYRLPQEWFNIVNHHLMMVKVHHTYSAIIKQAFAEASKTSPVIYVYFYYTHIIVLVMKEGLLQIVQSFTYQSNEDVLYYLLNISQRFNVNKPGLIMKVSGVLDLHASLYPELVKYFKNVQVQNVDKNQVMFDMHNYPQHYFTPFFNLAL